MKNFRGRKLLPGEIGRRVTIREMAEDWAGAGHSAVLRVKNPLTKQYADLAMGTVPGDAYAARRTTIATDFPVDGGYEGQVITFLAGIEQWKSDLFIIPVGKNVANG